MGNNLFSSGRSNLLNLTTLTYNGNSDEGDADGDDNVDDHAHQKIVVNDNDFDNNFVVDDVYYDNFVDVDNDNFVDDDDDYHINVVDDSDDDYDDYDEPESTRKRSTLCRV